MKQCPSCHRQNTDDVVFCGYCGTSLDLDMPKYLPGFEPEKVKEYLNILFSDIDKCFPDKKIYREEWNHERWDNAAGSLCTTLGYKDGRSFLEAYGYQVVNRISTSVPDLENEINNTHANTDSKPEQRHTKPPKSSSRLVENIIATICALAIAIYIFSNIDSEWLNTWLHSPIVWNDPGYIEVKIIDKQETYSPRSSFDDIMQGTITLTFSIKNYWVRNIDSCTILLYINGFEEQLRVYSLDSRSETTKTVKYTNYNFSRETAKYNKLKGKELNDIRFTYHIKTVVCNSEKVVNQNSTWKFVIILIVSIVSAILIWKDFVKSPFFRIILKVIMIPAIIVYLGLQAIPGALENYNSPDEIMRRERDIRERRIRSLQQQYDRVSGFEQGYIRTGNYKEAARVHSELERIKTEIISNK